MAAGRTLPQRTGVRRRRATPAARAVQPCPRAGAAPPRAITRAGALPQRAKGCGAEHACHARCARALGLPPRNYKGAAVARRNAAPARRSVRCRRATPATRAALLCASATATCFSAYMVAVAAGVERCPSAPMGGGADMPRLLRALICCVRASKGSPPSHKIAGQEWLLRGALPQARRRSATPVTRA